MTFDAGAEAMMARSACRDVVRGLSHDELTMVLQRAFNAGLAEAEKVARDECSCKRPGGHCTIADAIARLRKGAD